MKTPYKVALTLTCLLAIPFSHFTVYCSTGEHLFFWYAALFFINGFIWVAAGMFAEDVV